MYIRRQAMYVSENNSTAPQIRLVWCDSSARTFRDRRSWPPAIARHLTVKVALYRIYTASAKQSRNIHNTPAIILLKRFAVLLLITLPIVLVRDSSNGPNTQIIRTEIQVRAVSRGDVRTPASTWYQLAICFDAIASTADDFEATASIRSKVQPI